MSPDAAVATLVLGGTALWTGFAYLGPQLDGGPLRDTPEAARAVPISRGKALGGVAMAAGAVALTVVVGGSPAALVAAHQPLWAAAIGVSTWCIVAAAVWAAAGKPKHQERYPELRMARWTRPWVLRSAASWAAYLTGYELVFRGALFLAVVPALGVPVAAAVSTGLYVLAHLRKDAAETWSCFAMGPLFCALAWYGGMAAPIALHVAIAVSAELATLRRHPGIVVEPG